MPGKIEDLLLRISIYGMLALVGAHIAAMPFDCDQDDEEDRITCQP